MDDSNSIENEVQELFNGLPVQKGVDAIIASSEYKFKYAKSIGLLSVSENWFTEIDRFDYLDSPTQKVELQLSRSPGEKDVGEENIDFYYCSLRLFYEDKETMAQEFFKITKTFEGLGDKVNTETVQREDYSIKEQSVYIHFKKKKYLPLLTFSFSEEQIDSSYQIFINYQNYLHTEKRNHNDHYPPY